MKEKKKVHSYFYKMVLFFLMTIFFTSIVLTVFSFGQFSDALRERTYADYQSALKKNAQSWQDLSGEITQLKDAIIVEPQTEAYFELSQFEASQDYHTYLRVKKLFNINPFVVSFCLYNAAADEALYCGTDTIPFAELWEKLCTENNSFILRTNMTGNKNQGILVYGYPVYTDSFDTPKGAIFISLDMEKVRTHVMGGGNYGQLLLDEEQTILLYNRKGEEHAVLQEWVSRQSGERKNESITIGTEEYLCSYYKEKGIAYISYVNDKEVRAVLTEKRGIFLLVCLLVTALSAGLQLIVIKKIYKPIAFIRQVFADSKYAGEESLNEFQLIQHVYQKAMAEVEELEARNAMYVPRMKTNTLRGLITGNISPRQAKETLESYGCHIPFAGMFLSSILLEDEQESGLRLDVILAKIQQLAVEKAGNLFLIECLTIGSSEMVLLINTKGGQATFEELVGCLENILSIIVSEYNIQMTIALDGMVTDMADCSGIYLRVKELQKNKFALGMNQVIYAGRVQELLPEPLAYPDKLMNDILASLSQQESESFESKTGDFVEMIGQYTYQAASILFARLYLECVARVQQFKVAGRSKAAHIDMTMNPGTKEEARRLLGQIYHIYQARRQEAEEIKDDKHYGKILLSQTYIQENYSDSTLSVDSIAERFGYSTNYFARLFKSITGYYINDYIRQIRIVNAQRLLADSSMTINEIAEATGFTTSNYFYSIFKKETGMTPAAYRSQKI